MTSMMMRRKGLALLLAVALIAPWAPPVGAVGNCGVASTYNTGDSVTAGNLNANLLQAAQTNTTFACLDDLSGTAGAMQANTDPYASETESLATSGAGELERLRYVLKNVFGFTQWYIHTQNVNFAGVGVTRTGVQGAGYGAHVTAVALHAGAGYPAGVPTPAIFPVITSLVDHQTGIAFPQAGHISVVIRDGNLNGGAKGGIEMMRWHATGIILHHTAALMFAHSTGWSPGSQSQLGHITAVSVSRGLVSVAGNEAAHRDTLLFGHAGTVMNLVGYGASHIALGAQGYIALGRHVGTMAGPNTPVKNALYADTIIKGWARWNGTTANTPVLGGFNIVGITDNGTGDYTVTWQTSFLDANYVAVVMGDTTTNYVISLATGTTRTNHGAPTDCTLCGVIAVGSQ